MTALQPQLAQPVIQNLRPYNSSHFLPGKVCGRSVLFLIDTGCTTSILVKYIFDQLPATACQLMHPYADAHGTLADGSAAFLWDSKAALPGEKYACVRDVHY